jgi:hypothetical protein
MVGILVPPYTTNGTDEDMWTRSIGKGRSSAVEAASLLQAHIVSRTGGLRKQKSWRYIEESVLLSVACEPQVAPQASENEKNMWFKR